MTATAQTRWRSQFGIEDREPPVFFTGVRDIDATAGAVPQSHALRRAFDDLSLDGVLCQEKIPVIYFRQVSRIDAVEVATLHRRFWNHGVAPILALIAPDQVHVYSALATPAAPGEAVQAPGLVETLDCVGAELRRFILSVESGEYFHAHRKSFDPVRRVDRNLLRDLQIAREELQRVRDAGLDAYALDSLLCRLVFTCYLFDRKVIGDTYLKDLDIRGAVHLRDILAHYPRTNAKAELYRLFEQLAKDFNGDLFSDDLSTESRQIRAEHLKILDQFFHGTNPRSGQKSFWPYDFSVIPIETISAIYEHFLKIGGAAEKKQTGAFYTPRFLAELVLDLALDGKTSLLDKRFLDPACGSGIFLVGIFNRMAEEWKRNNPGARYDRRADGLMQILQHNLFGVDRNRTACQITAFSLYLAFLDQLSPPDIRELQRKGKFLPHLVCVADVAQLARQEGMIRCADFFKSESDFATKVDFVVGNPPWARVPASDGGAAQWCSRENLPFPDGQIATAFMWKAGQHLEPAGRACLVLPHGTLFNHKKKAVAFQREFFQRHAVDQIVNLVDYQRFLFEESEAPAVVILYRKARPANSAHRIDYWAPKTDWKVTQAEIVSVNPQDRTQLTVREVLDDLTGADAPLIWKQRLWATPREWRLLDRLSLLPRLREYVASASHMHPKRWIIGQGFEERAGGASETKQLVLPTKRIIEASSPLLHLFLLRDDCGQLPSREVTVRKRSNTNTHVYKSPHVLITHGYSRVAFADFAVAFRHALRGIHGPVHDRDLLVFLAAYFRSRLAKFFLFHRSSNWGVSRAKVHVQELLRLPFAPPERFEDPRRRQKIVSEVARKVTKSAERANEHLPNRQDIVRETQKAVEPLIEEYFDIDDMEGKLIADTVDVVIPSVRPTRARPDVPSMRHSTVSQRAEFTNLLCAMLNGWANRKYLVHGKTVADSSIGIGLVLLEKTRYGNRPVHLNGPMCDVVKAIDSLQRAAVNGRRSFELVRGTKVFHEDVLYITKPLALRFWTHTAALNDADEIAATVLMHSGRERV